MQSRRCDCAVDSDCCSSVLSDSARSSGTGLKQRGTINASPNLVPDTFVAVLMTIKIPIERGGNIK
jgi:hypothetical protein